jgi:DNA-binding phage protein
VLGLRRSARSVVLAGQKLFLTRTFDVESPTAVAYAVEIARRLEHGMGDRSKAGVAREANLERSTVYDLLSGRSWPDAITIAQLEQVLQTRLWPDHPVPPLKSTEAS